MSTPGHVVFDCCHYVWVFGTKTKWTATKRGFLFSRNSFLTSVNQGPWMLRSSYDSQLSIGTASFLDVKAYNNPSLYARLRFKEPRKKRKYANNWAPRQSILLVFLVVFFVIMYFNVCFIIAQWLRCCATNRKVAGSILAGVTGIFHWRKILPIALWPWGRLSL